jgi:hypothetical protein
MSLYQCPNCGQTDDFFIYGAIEIHQRIIVDSDGNCLDTSGGDIEWEGTNSMKCPECMFEGQVKDFPFRGRKRWFPEKSE